MKLAVILLLALSGCGNAPFINVNMGGEPVAIDCPEYVPMPSSVKQFIAEHRKTAAADKPEVETWLAWLADDVQGLLTSEACE